MTNKIPLFLLLCSLCFSFACSEKEAAPTAAKNTASTSETDLNKWKKLSICFCLQEAIPLSDSIRKKDGSLAGYFMTSAGFGIESLEKTKDFIKTYLDTASHLSSVNKDLSMMKCLDLYNNTALEAFIRKLNEENLKH